MLHLIGSDFAFGVANGEAKANNPNLAAYPARFHMPRLASADIR